MLLLGILIGAYIVATYGSGVFLFKLDDDGVGRWFAWFLSPISVPGYLLLAIIIAAIGWAK